MTERERDVACRSDINIGNLTNVGFAHWDQSFPDRLRPMAKG
jgi:hypothetical protein